MTDPERPWATPLRAALQRFEEVVPLLLDAGARPTAGDPAASMFHNRYSDLHLAITHCPHHSRPSSKPGRATTRKTPMKKTSDGKCLFQVMLEKVSAHWLQDPRVLATLKHIGYDPRLSTDADGLKKLFSYKVASKKTVWQTTEELESLVEGWWMELTLPSSSPVVSAPRPRM